MKHGLLVLWFISSKALEMTTNASHANMEPLAGP